jgi:predicted component of type VI protein secretion system
MADSAPAAFLVPVSGPPMERLVLRPGKQGVVLGRHQTCGLKMPSEMEAVSRFHVEFRHDGERWRVTDLGSGWGTYVNGVKLTAHIQTPLADGDLIRITPWIFSFGGTDTRRGLTTFDDKHSSTVRSLTSEQLPPLRDDLLALFLEASAAIHSAESEKQLAERMMDVARRGTGLSHAVFLRPLDAEGRIEVIAESPASVPGRAASFSRSLLAAAAKGQVAELSAGGGDISQSVVMMNVAAAICAPLMLGGAPAAFLYLDSK